MKLSISVAMCTYNGERYLLEQLGSIAQQTRLPDELVICDDCSTDATAEIVADFAKSASFPVRLVRNPHNLGATRNFEQAIALCAGDLIALCDQDDIWLPEKLERQAALMEQDELLGGVFSDAQLINDQSRQVDGKLWATFQFTQLQQRRFRNGRAASVLLSGSVVTGATLMFRRSLRETFEPIPPAWVHDGWIAWMIVLHSRLFPMDIPLIRYRVHSNQLVGVGGMTPYSDLPMRQRFKTARREEPEKYLKLAQELQEIKLRADRIDESRAKCISSAVQEKIWFLTERGNIHRSRSLGFRWILRNMRKYHQFDHGWKCWLRDLAMLYL